MKRLLVEVNGTKYDVKLEELGADEVVEKSTPTSGGQSVEAPMPGNIMSINVSQGDVVSSGDTLMILESMKMENEILAPNGGTVSSINVSQGDNVNMGDVLVELE